MQGYLLKTLNYDLIFSSFKFTDFIVHTRGYIQEVPQCTHCLYNLINKTNISLALNGINGK